jgi:tetratricopeptide (TPR) repeat protein
MKLHCGVSQLWTATLRALGRLREAVAPMQSGLERYIALEAWEGAAQATNNLSGLHLALGNIGAAVATVEYADDSGDLWQRLGNRVALAGALHQLGQFTRANELFQVSESMLGQHRASRARLYGSWGYNYCALLLNQGNREEVRERATLTMEWTDGRLLDIALNHLSLGQAALALGERGEARGATRPRGRRYAQSRRTGVSGPRSSGPRGIVPGDKRTLRDLEEAMRIARRSEMQLFQCDAHLEYARLALAEGDEDQAREHVAEARRLVDETGYGLRRSEVEALEPEVR